MKVLVLFFTFLSLILAMNSKDDEFFKDVNQTCAVKFINVFKAPNFIAALEYKDGKKVLFSSAKLMFYYYFNADKSEFKNLYVTDYKNKNLINAKKAFYVFGSRIVSSSGDDLIPFSSLEDALEFSKENSGHKLFFFNEITKNLILYLD